MKTVLIKGTAREAVGKKACKALRAEGLVPCVLYGGEVVVHFAAPVAEFRKIIYTPNVYMINLQIDGKETMAIVQATQFNPVTDEVMHIDFLQISEDKPVKIDVPVKLEGFAKGIQQGGKLKLNLRTLRVKALSKDLPDFITLDVTNLGLGESTRVGDIQVEGLTMLQNASVPVAAVMITRAARAAMNAAKAGKE